MNDVVLYDYKLQFTKSDLPSLITELSELWFNIERIYSYIVTVNNDIIYVKYIIAEITMYNTICVDCALSKIGSAIKDQSKTGVIVFGQPDIELYIMLHEPMIEKMSLRMLERWPKMEYEDLCQICRLCCIELHEKGYFLHKRLIWTTFKNKIIEEVRPLKKRGALVSIYDKSHAGEGEDKDLTIADTLVDTECLYQEQDDENHETEKRIFEEVKDIIVELIGQRQFDMLYRDYKNKHTTTTSRKLLIKVKNHLNALGLSRNDFNNKYY